MVAIVSDTPVEQLQAECWVQWKPGVDCPNVYAYVLETLRAPGFMRVCAHHFDSYSRDVGLDGVKVWSREEWEGSQRKVELEALLGAP